MTESYDEFRSRMIEQDLAQREIDQRQGTAIFVKVTENLDTILKISLDEGYSIDECINLVGILSHDIVMNTDPHTLEYLFLQMLLNLAIVNPQVREFLGPRIGESFDLEDMHRRIDEFLKENPPGNN